MPTPGELKTATLKELRATRADLTSAEWLLSLPSQPAEVRRDAAHKLLDIEQALLALGTATLADIRDKLVANEPQLVAGIEAMAEARKKLERVKAVLTAAGKLLEVVAKVVKFAATAVP
jgi:hypothetical protein